MLEILCVILGWFLSMATIWTSNLSVSKKKNIAMLKMLIENLDDEAKATIHFLSSNHSFLGYSLNENKWWHYNKMLYLQELPTEADIFNKWNTANENLEALENNSSSVKRHASLTKETRNSLLTSLQYWQQPLWKLCLCQMYKTK